MRVGLTVAEALALTGATSSFEHPRDRGVDPYPSIWPLPEMQHLESTEHHERKLRWQREEVDLCMFGGSSLTPRTFTLNCKNTGELGRKCTHPKGYHQAPKESKVDGKFSSAELKYYPQPLNRKLAKVHFETMSSSRIDGPFARDAMP